MQTIEKTIYSYFELTDSAKNKAREWYCGLIETNDYAESVYEWAQQVAEVIGIEFDTRENGKSPEIWFSGFCNQGDGACFEGSYSYAKGSKKRIRDFAPNEAELHRIVDSLQAIQKKHFYGIRATMSHRGHYYHSGCMSVNVEHDGSSIGRGVDVSDFEDEITQIMRDFADWIYKKLESEYDYQTLDETIAENIEANFYEFDENGNKV